MSDIKIYLEEGTNKELITAEDVKCISIEGTRISSNKLKRINAAKEEDYITLFIIAVPYTIKDLNTWQNELPTNIKASYDHKLEDCSVAISSLDSIKYELTVKTPSVKYINAEDGESAGDKK